MAERDFYNKKEVDSMFKSTKENLLKQIDETVHVGSKFPEKPTVAKQTFTMQIVRSEVK